MSAQYVHKDGDVHVNVDLKSPEDKLTVNEEALQLLQKLKGDITYGVTDFPPWHLSILMAFQHYLTMFGATVAIPFLLSDALCMSRTDVARSELISTIFFVSGMATLLQVLFGVRTV